MIAASFTKTAQRKATLLHVVGKAARDIYYARAQAHDTYEDVRDILQDHFTPLRNVDFILQVWTNQAERTRSIR
jgi:hypothetical protein